jgi:hypothetical protein
MGKNYTIVVQITIEDYVWNRTLDGWCCTIAHVAR